MQLYQKRRLQHRYFPVNFAKFLGTLFFKEHFWLLLLLFDARMFLMSTHQSILDEKTPLLAPLFNFFSALKLIIFYFVNIVLSVITAWKQTRSFSGPYSVRMRENMDQKKRIQTLFTQWRFFWHFFLKNFISIEITCIAAVKYMQMLQYSCTHIILATNCK